MKEKMESLIQYQQFTGLERLAKYHALVIELNCASRCNLQAVANPEELTAANGFFIEHDIPFDVAVLFRPDRAPDLADDREDWWMLDCVALCIARDIEPEYTYAYAFPIGDELPAVHAHLEECHEDDELEHDSSVDEEAAVELLTAQELADYLGIHRETVYVLTHEGKIPGCKVGATWRYRLAQVLVALAIPKCGHADSDGRWRGVDQAAEVLLSRVPEQGERGEPAEGDLEGDV